MSQKRVRTGFSMTKRLEVERMGFLLERLVADTPINQQLRELNQNCIEEHYFAAFETETLLPGKIVWDIRSLLFYATNGIYKLSVTDNGDGMSPDDMIRYLNNLSVQGAGGNQGLTANFGVGAKITALARNPCGLVYRSWRSGHGAMVQPHRDDDQGEYGLRAFELPDGTLTYHPSLTAAAKPDLIAQSGTKVTLLGTGLEANTVLPTSRNANWALAFLHSRYFELPANIEIGVRVVTRDVVTKGQRVEPIPCEKTYNIRKKTALRELFDTHAGTRIHVGSNAYQTPTFTGGYLPTPTTPRKTLYQIGIDRTTCRCRLSKRSLLRKRGSDAARRAMVYFGIVYGVDHVCLYIVPRPDLGPFNSGRYRSPARASQRRRLASGDWPFSPVGKRIQAKTPQKLSPTFRQLTFLS